MFRLRKPDKACELIVIRSQCLSTVDFGLVISDKNICFVRMISCNQQELRNNVGIKKEQQQLRYTILQYYYIGLHSHRG